MSKDIPEIDDLTRGINDSELILTQDSVETQVEQKEKNNEAQEKDNNQTFRHRAKDQGILHNYRRHKS